MGSGEVARLSLKVELYQNLLYCRGFGRIRLMANPALVTTLYGEPSRPFMGIHKGSRGPVVVSGDDPFWLNRATI